jgi:hypothetical protein
MHSVSPAIAEEDGLASPTSYSRRMRHVSLSRVSMGYYDQSSRQNSAGASRQNSAGGADIFNHTGTLDCVPRESAGQLRRTQPTGGEPGGQRWGGGNGDAALTMGSVPQPEKGDGQLGMATKQKRSKEVRRKGSKQQSM